MGSSSLYKAVELIGIQVFVLVAIHWASRAQRSDAERDENLFRIVPAVAWTIAIACPLISVVYAVAAFVPGYHHRGLFLGFSLLFFIVAIYGAYCVSVRIKISSSSLMVSSLFGTRQRPFSEIASIDDRAVNRTRILKVKDKRGKQILYGAEWYIADYAMPVDLLREGVSLSRRAG